MTVPTEEPVADADERRHYTTYRWLDRHGRNRLADVLSEAPPGSRVWAYSPDDDGGQTLVAAVTPEGKFWRLSVDLAVDYGLDTAAAWNNLIEICRAAHLANR